MFGYFRWIGLAIVLVTGSVRAGDNKVIQGSVIGEDGKGVSNAQVRAQRLDAKARIATAKTDARGHYIFEILPAGSYALTAYIYGYPKSRATIRTGGKGWAKVDFDLRLNEPQTDEVNRMQRDIQTSSGSVLGR
ncbi:MAG: carboxypeptidase-like regulatory domain-containing protein [Chthoniobacterales bacterium]